MKKFKELNCSCKTKNIRVCSDSASSSEKFILYVIDYIDFYEFKNGRCNYYLLRIAGNLIIHASIQMEILNKQ